MRVSTDGTRWCLCDCVRGFELLPFLCAEACAPAFLDAVFEHLFPKLVTMFDLSVWIKFLETYLRADYFPFIFLPVFMRKFERIDVLFLPKSELLAQTLVPHLQRCDLEHFVLLLLEAIDDVFPWDVTLQVR